MAYKLKTQKNRASVDEFVDGIEPEWKRRDSVALKALMEEATGEIGAMWGSNIVGFGRYSYTYKSGQNGEWFRTGFSPRKQNLTIYIMSGFDGQEELLDRLGKHRRGKSCLYVNRLSDIDMDVLRKLVSKSAEIMATAGDA